MAIEMLVPRLGKETNTGVVVHVFVKPGDQVNRDQAVFEIEVEKGMLFVPCGFSGIVTEVLIQEGQTVTEGQAAVAFDEASVIVGTVKQILVAVGDHVEMGQTMFTVEIQGNIVEVPSDTNGTVQYLYLREGAPLRADQDLFYIEQDATDNVEQD